MKLDTFRDQKLRISGVFGRGRYGKPGIWIPGGFPQRQTKGLKQYENPLLEPSRFKYRPLSLVYSFSWSNNELNRRGNDSRGRA